MTKFPRPEGLSRREFEVYCAIANGEAQCATAVRLQLTDSSVSTYRQRVLRKLGLKRNVDIIMLAHGLAAWPEAVWHPCLVCKTDATCRNERVCQKTKEKLVHPCPVQGKCANATIGCWGKCWLETQRQQLNDTEKHVLVVEGHGNGPDEDRYLGVSIPSFVQLFERYGWKEGDAVKVTITVELSK